MAYICRDCLFKAYIYIFNKNYFRVKFNLVKLYWWIHVIVIDFVSLHNLTLCRPCFSLISASKFSELKLIEVVIFRVYYTIPFAFSLFRHVYKCNNAYSRDLNAWEFLWIFIYLIRWIRHKGREMYWCMYMYGNTESARIAWWIFTKLGRDKALMTPAHLHWLLGQIRPGRIQGRAIIGQWVAPSSKNCFFFRPEGYSNKLNA